MTISASDLDADLTAIIADYPQSITFGGTAYACAADDMSEGRNPADAGIFGDNSIDIHVRSGLFTTRPVAGNTLVYRTRTMRIVAVKTSLDDLMLTLTCEEQTA